MISETIRNVCWVCCSGGLQQGFCVCVGESCILSESKGKLWTFSLEESFYRHFHIKFQGVPGLWRPSGWGYMSKKNTIIVFTSLWGRLLSPGNVVTGGKGDGRNPNSWSLTTDLGTTVFKLWVSPGHSDPLLKQMLPCLAENRVLWLVPYTIDLPCTLG